MWDTATVQNSSDLVCYVFHHWSGQKVDRSEIVVTSACCTPIPQEDTDDSGLPAWFLFRSVPRRLCPQAGNCTRCTYALGEVTRKGPCLDAVTPQHTEHGGFSISA